MALISPSIIQPRRVVEEPEEKESTWEILAKGLTAANQALGIATKVSSLQRDYDAGQTEELRQQAMQAQKDTLARQQAGQFRTAELPGAGLIEVPKAQQGGLGVRQITVDDQPTFVMSQQQFQTEKGKQQADEQRLSSIIKQAKQQKTQLAKDTKERNRQIEEDRLRANSIVNDPTSRRLFGKYQTNIDSADAIQTLLKGAAEEAREHHGQDLTDEEAWDKLTNQEVFEVVKSLDRMLSQAAPTVEGTNHLLAQSYWSDLQGLRQKVVNSPQGVGLGAFVARYSNTVNRERNLNLEKKMKRLEGITAAFEHVKEADPARWETMVNAATEQGMTHFVTNPAALKNVQPIQILGGQPQQGSFNPDAFLKPEQNFPEFKGL